MGRNPYSIATFVDLLKEAEEHQIVVPNFQRGFEWDRKTKQKGLASSAICQLPIGAMVLYQGSPDAFDHRLLCESKSIHSSKQELLYLLDGQQRLSTLRSIFSDLFHDYVSWEQTLEGLFPALQTRWVLRLREVSDDNNSYIFGIKNGPTAPFLDLGEAANLPDEPSDIRPFIHAYRITKTEAKSSEPAWWHPAFQASLAGEGKTDHEIRRAVAAQAAKDWSIPLWELAHVDELEKKKLSPLHLLVARQIEMSEIEGHLRNLLDHDPESPVVKSVVSQTDPSVHERPTSADELTRLVVQTGSHWASTFAQTLHKVVDLQIPTITVAGNDLRRAVTIFENINEAGTQLSTFDLVNARAVPGYEKQAPLRDRVIADLSTGDIKVPKSLKPILVAPNKIPAEEVTGVSGQSMPATVRNQYLNMLSILGHLGDDIQDKKLTVDHIKKAKQLALNSDQINSETQEAASSVVRACMFLQYRCGLVAPESISYALMMLPIAYVLRKDKWFRDPVVWKKLEYWYWAALFSGHYREQRNETCIKDVQMVQAWCANESDENPYIDLRARVLEEPRYSAQSAFLPEKGEPTFHSAVVEGILQFELAQRPPDFLPKSWKPVRLWAPAIRKEERVETERPGGTKQEYQLEIQRHHIVPLASVTSLGESSAKLREKETSLYNSPLNLTYISSFANNLIGGRKPDGYLDELPDDVLRQHYITKGGTDVWNLIKTDNPLADNPVEDGIRKLLQDRFEELKTRIGMHLDNLVDAL